MKYNDKAFNISKQYYPKIQDVKIDNIDKKWQNKLLNILLKRFKEELENNKNQNNGIIKVKFRDQFWKDSEEGYNLIKELVEAGKFDSFASKYFMYLGNVETRYDELHTAYFEIIWDYKSYFELINKNITENIIKDTDIDKEELLSALKNLKELPVKYKLEILKSFLEKVKECKENYSNDELVKTCTNEGHQFSNWEKKVISNYEDCWIDHELIHNYKIEEIFWQRTCNRCGHIEIAKEEPKELVEERKEKAKQKEIKRLERRLQKLKEGN